MKTTYRVEHRARTSRVIEHNPAFGDQIVASYYSNPPMRAGEQRHLAVLKAEELRHALKYNGR